MEISEDTERNRLRQVMHLMKTGIRRYDDLREHRKIGIRIKKQFREAKELTFNKEETGWYLYLPNWREEKSALRMVAGAEKLLDKLSDKKKTVTLFVSEEEPTEAGFEKITKMAELPLVGGATYWTSYWPIWICNVARFIYDGEMPDVLYYKVVQ